MSVFHRRQVDRVVRAASFVGCLAFGAWSTSGCGEGITGNPDDPATANCGRMTDTEWTAPSTCTCTGPAGQTTFRPAGTSEIIDITCDDRRLQPCPSTSGIGCELPTEEQGPVDADDPALVNIHVDIGGHMHDVCCNEHYSSEDGVGFHLRCNGCGGKAPDGEIEVCENQSPILGGLLDKPENTAFPCGAEWGYAVRAFAGPDVFWRTEFDTSLRWTPEQVVERNMGGTGGPYTRPDGDGGERPLFGRALAPSLNDATDHRAPSAMLLGTSLLSDPYDALTGGLGMNAEQISSFCRSESATFDDAQAAWVCD